MPGDHAGLPDDSAAPVTSWWGRGWQRLHSRFARHLALTAVVIGAIAAAGHFVGGMIGWWHAYEITFGGHDAGKPGVAARAKAPLLSIVVLPFENAGGGEDAWFAETLTNDVALELTRVPDSSVIGREAAARLAGRDADPREVARELGVRYVLLGSVERDGDRVRLRVRLLDGETGAQRWAERFDVARAALRGMVDDLARKLARAVDLEMVRSAGSAAARLAPEAIRADDLAMQGWATLYRGINPQNNDEALALFERAVAMDPRSVRGWGGVAYANGNIRRWAQSESALRRIGEASEQLERLDPDGYYGLLARGILAHNRRDAPAALAAGARMVELFPGHHGAYTMRGTVLVRLGRFEEALADTEKAIALLPSNPDTANEWRRSFIHYGLGRFGESAAEGRRLLARAPRNRFVIFTLAAALVRDGKPDEAGQVLAEARRQYPDLSTAMVAQLALDGSGERFVAARDDMLAALREAGLQ